MHIVNFRFKFNWCYLKMYFWKFERLNDQNVNISKTLTWDFQKCSTKSSDIPVTNIMEELESFLADDMIVYNCSMNDSMITSYNWTVEHYLYCMRGPKRLHMSVLLPITIVYFGIFVTGVIGNIAVCVVIVNNTSLHTATNYYLFSLAVSDLTLLLLGKLATIIFSW